MTLTAPPWAPMPIATQPVRGLPPFDIALLVSGSTVPPVMTISFPLVPGAAALADGVSVHVGVRLQNAAVDVDVSRASLARRGDRVRRTLGGGGNAVIERVGKLIGGRRGVLGVMRPRAASDGDAMG